MLAAGNVARGQWTEPVLIDSNEDSLGINTGHMEWCPFLSADEQYFYFARERINNDLYVCHRTESGWSEPQMLPFCTVNGDERNPSVNATNDTLYFITFSGGWDIFWSFRSGPCDTCWGTPERLPEPINSTGIEFSVWCAPDNQRLLFSSWRSGGIGGEDIYECRRDANTPTGWSEPIRLQGRLNTDDLESYPSMGLDTTEAFFWGRYSRVYQSEWTDTGWTRGDSLPNEISGLGMTTPCIVPDGHRLYFCRFRNADSTVNAGDIWYTERPSVIGPFPKSNQEHRQGLRIEVFPNPIRGNAWVEVSGGAKQITLFNLLGRKIMSMEFKRPEQQVLWLMDLHYSGFASGTYFVIADNGTELRSVRIQLLK